MRDLPAADQAERDRARFELGANVVVEAGAGTGKTTLLIDRLLHHLLAGEGAVEITRLAALTFTEKAAAEIKVRLADRLSEAAAGTAPRLLRELRERFSVDGESAARLARRALEDLDKAQIGTIHSFAAHVLRAFPVEAGVDPGFSVDEGPFFEELFEAEWAAFLDVELGEAPPRCEEWLAVLRLCTLEDLRALAWELCRERLDLDLIARPDPASAARLEKLALELEGLRGLPPPGARSRILESIAAAAARLRETARAARAPSPELPERLDYEELKSRSWPKAWGEFSGQSELYERALDCARAGGSAGEALLRRACALVLPMARDFRRAYARRGWVSFDGLLRRARDLVRDDPAAREELKSRYAVLLIDEFQDTDPLQGEFLLLLAEALKESAPSWRRARLAAGRLFVVGDPKQSIYRFRGADIAAYQSFSSRILESGAAQACALLSNFRSPPGLIGPVNAVFERLMKPLDGLQAAYKPLSSDRAAGTAPALELIVAEDCPDAAAARRLEARAIADWIARRCGPGKEAGYKDVAILARTSLPFAELVDALRDAGVPYAIESEKGFYGVPEVLDLINLLRVLDDPGDEIALVGLLRSPLCLLSDQEIYELSRSGRLAHGGPCGIRRADLLLSQLRCLRRRVGRLPTSELVDAALRETNLQEMAAAAYHGAQTLANLAKFARLAQAASDERGLSLKEFIGELLRGLADPHGEGESPLADEHLEAVRLLTIHKSKGLEFPIVFLANASAAPGSGRKAAALLDWSSGSAGLRLERCGAASAAMAWLAPEEERRQEHEAVRLLYVALTRAKERLFIVGQEKGRAGCLSGLLRRCGAWPEPESDMEALELAGFRIPVRRVKEDFKPARARSAPPPAALPDAAALAETYLRRLKDKERLAAEPWTRTPTGMPLEMPQDDGPPPRKERAASPLGSLVGALCHRVLEATELAAPPRGPALEQAVLRAAEALASVDAPRELEGARKEAEAILAGFLDSQLAKNLARLKLVGREVPFCHADGAVLVRGRLDLLCRRPDGRLLVVDYKSERVDEGSAPALLRAHRAQGEAYREAVRRALGQEADFAVVFLRRPELSDWRG
ncbi:MAG: UvrD-helicase domain-containing protein [Elusimicrobia bacterium]|nr:UvrD-helicase domain-containing protein [Elusimicrobiota bacterium]